MNKVMLIGNVGKDPEVRYVDNGVCTAKVALATNTPGYTLPNGTQVPDRAEWHNLLFWRRLAEVVERYVRKGDKLYVEGELRTRNYTDHQGIVRYVTEIWVNNMEMLTPKSQSGAAKTEASATATDGTSAHRSAPAATTQHNSTVSPTKFTESSANGEAPTNAPV